MTDIKFSLSKPETITISCHTVDKLIRAGDGDVALLYLYILTTGGRSNLEDSAFALSKTSGEIATAMAALSRLNLINLDHESSVTPASPETTQRSYSPSEIAEEKNTNSVFAALVDETQKSMGKILNGDELERLMGMYDSLRLPAEVILQLITHCIAESRHKSSGRMPSMRYIESAAFRWQREGINTLEAAEEYLKRLENIKSARGSVKKLLQISGRELSASEKKYIDQWISMGFENEVIELAYELTILNTGKLAYSYMNTILKKWHEKGLLKAEQVKAQENGVKKLPFNAERNATHMASRDTNYKYGSVDSAEMKRMEKLLSKIKEGQQ